MHKKLTFMIKGTLLKILGITVVVEHGFAHVLLTQCTDLLIVFEGYKYAQKKVSMNFAASLCMHGCPSVINNNKSKK